MPRLDPFADLIAPQSQPSDPFADLIAPSAPAAPSRPSTGPTQSRYDALSRLETPQARTSDLVLPGRGSMPDDRTVEEQRVIESAPVYNPPSLPRPTAPLPKHDPMVDPETVAEYERAKAMHAKQGYPLNNDPDAGLLDDLRTWLVGGTMQGVKGAVGVADTFRAVTDALPAPLAALGGIVPQPGMPQPGEVVRDTVSLNDIEQGLNAGQSAGTQAEQKRFSEAKGIIEKAGVALTSPRLIAKSIVESIPLMVGGAWAGKALVGSTPLAAAIGEGAGMMGVDAETMAESNDDGRLQPKQAMLAAAIGTLGAAIGRYSSALAGKLGVADADMLLVGAVQNPKIKRALARNIAVGMVQEGVFEELPQGLVETALTNIATGKPITEGMADDAILGTITGAAMGGGAQVLSAPAQAEAARQAKAEEDRRAENTQRFNAANERYFARFTPEGRATALEQWRAEQQAKAEPPATQDDVTATFARMMARQTENRAEIPVETALIGQTIDQPIGQTPEVSDSAFTDLPVAGDTVDGRTVLDEIPNQDSIDSSLTDYEVLPGVREVPMSAFDPAYKVKPYSVSESDRLDRLQNDIARSNTIAPLIVVVDKERYPYILEGGHRFDALKRLGATSFPALVVLDRESLGDTAAATGQSAAAPAPMASFDDLIAPEPLSEIASTREQMSAELAQPADVAQRFARAPKVSVEFDNAGAIVVRFIKQPSYGTLEALKSRGFRWSKDDKAWYHRNPEKLTSERGDGALRFALEKTKALVGLPIDEDLRKPEFDYNEERKRKASIHSIPPADVSMESENIDTPTATRVSDDEARAALTDEGRVADAPEGAGRDWPMILGHARAQGYTGSPEALARAKREIEGFDASKREETDGSDNGIELLKAIRDVGGLKDDGGGEFSTLWEASTGFVPQSKTKAGDRYKRSKNYATGGVLGVGNVLVKYGKGGKTWDGVRESLSELPAFRRFADLSATDLMNEVMEVVGTRKAQGQVRERKARGLDYTTPGWWQDRINNAGYTPVEQEASDYLGTFTPEDRRELYEALRDDEDQADAMGVQAEIFKRLEQEYAGGNVAGTDQADVAGSRANDRTAEQGPRRAGQAATQGDRPTAQARPVSVDTLAEDFGLTPPAAQATMALVEAMGLDPQRILTTKGGEPGSGSLEQRQRSGGTVRASVEFMQSGEALIRALENPNASSAIHEIAHIARRWLMNRDVPAEQRRGITDQDIAIAETWAGVSDGKWTTKAEEKFARGFERYLRDGVSPTPRLSKIFKAFSQWLTEIYRTVTGSEIDVDISPAMREVFDRLVTRSERLAAGETQAKTAMVHGSPTRLDTLQPGSMFSNDPVWAAGYTTKLDAVGDGESFVGSVHGLDIPEGKTLTARSVHAAEGLVIDMATDILGRQPSSLKEAAEAVARDTGAVAVVAKNANGDATGGILLVSAPVTGYTDPKKALASARDEGREIPANLSQALERTKPGGPPRTKPSPVPEDIRTLGMDEDTAPEFGAALDVPADVRSSLETAEKAALDRLKKKRESGGVLYQADRKRKPKRSAVGTMRPFVEALGHGDLDGLISDGMYETFQSSFQLSDDGLDLREESTLNNGRDRAAGRTKAAPLSMFTNWLESPQADEAVAALDKKLYPGETPYAERLATARDVLKKVGAQASDVLYQSDAAEALPFDDRNDLLVIGAAKMARGITDFAKWSQAMTADLGDSIAPGLRDLYTASRNRAVLLSKFDPNDYFNFKRSALTGDTLEALKASVIDTVLATGRIPKEKETWDEIRVDAEYYGPEIVKYLAPFQKQQAQFRVVRYAAKQRIDALKADIYRDWQKIDRQRREGVLDPVAYAVEERKIDAKERDVRELLNVWMRMRSEDGRNLAMHRIIAERTWDDYEFWTRRAKKAMGLPPTVDLPAEVEKRINEIIQGGKIKIAERKARAPREAKPSGPPTSKPRTRVYVPKTPAQSKMLAAVEKMKAAMAAKAQAELGNVLYQADTVKTVDADLVQYAREFIEAAREDGTTDPEAAWSEFADIFGESYDGLRDAFEEAARDVFDAPDVVIPKVARGKRRGRLDDMRALGREDDGSPEFADPNAGKPSRREVRERQDIAAGAFGDTTPLEGMVEDDGTVEYADPNTPAPKAVKPSKADVQMREDAASGAFGQDIEDEVKRNLAKMLMELDQSTLGETALSVWKASLLLGLRTHELNMTSNALNQMALELRRIPGALADVAMSLVTGRRTMQGASFKSVLKASRKGAKEGAKRSVEVMRGGDALDTFIKTGTRRELNSGYPWLDTYANTVFRTLSAEDAFMRSIAFRRAMEEQAWLKAKALGITPAEVLLRPAESMIAQAITDAEIAAMEERAQEDAAEATFNQKNKIAGEWNRIVRNLKADPDYNPLGYFLDFTVPFTNTPANVTEAILKHIVPYGATKAALSAVRDRGLSAEQQRAIADGIGKAGIGWSLMYMGYALAAAGLMTGGGGSGDDRGDRNVQTAAGRIPGAILVNERWHTISGLAPVGTLMTVGATMYRATHRQDRAKSLSPKNIGAAVGQVMLDQPMVVGLHDLVQLLAGQVDERYTAKSVLASFIPNIISDAAALFDPYRREPRKDGFSAPMWDGIRMRLPGLRNYLPESSDVLGSAREQNRAMLVDLFRSTRAKELSDPVLKALLDADVGVTYPKRADGETEDAYRERSKKTGQMIEKMVKATVSSPSFARLPVETRTKLLKAAIDRAKDAVPAPRPPR